MLSPAAPSPSPNEPAPGVLDRDQQTRGAQGGPVPVDLPGGQASGDAHTATAPRDLPPAVRSSTSVIEAPWADLASDQNGLDAQEVYVAGDLGGGHGIGDTQSTSAPSDLAGSQAHHDAHAASVSRSSAEDALLLILADSLNDVEDLRKATGNQLSALTRDGEIPGGKGLSPHSRAAVMLADRLAVLEQFEHATVLELRRAMRAHPLGPWVKATVGIGEKQGARLIAAIGDPGWNRAEDRPRRGPAELWAYCGYAPGQKRRKGVRSNWNAEAKMRAFLCAESCMKQRTSPYRKVYDDARGKWADRDTSDAHKHAHALRCVAKAILKDLWREARADEGPQPSGTAPGLRQGEEA